MLTLLGWTLISLPFLMFAIVLIVSGLMGGLIYILYLFATSVYLIAPIIGLGVLRAKSYNKKKIHE